MKNSFLLYILAILIVGLLTFAGCNRLLSETTDNPNILKAQELSSIVISYASPQHIKLLEAMMLRLSC